MRRERIRTSLSPLALVLFLPLVGCGTPEYRAERSLCEAVWLERIPPRYERRIVERTRYEEVPTGQTTCTTDGDKTTCVSAMRTIAIPYTTVETVDANEPARDARIRACTAEACVKKYGNAECKLPGQ